MNDLDLVRAMRADAPDPASDRLTAGRERLRSATTPRRASYRGPVMILAGGLAVAPPAAAVLVTRPAPAAPHPAGRPPSACSVPLRCSIVRQLRPKPGPR